MGFYEVLKLNPTKPEDPDTPDLVDCVRNTVKKLLETDTTIHRPGILLGKIQSGKTRAFLRVLALAFDSGYDVAIVLTKGTKALARQTLIRLQQDFGQFIKSDQLQVYDILFFPENLTSYELNQKMIIVAKKEKNNLARAIRALTSTYPDLKEKKILIVDDEADFASLTFRKTAEGQIELGVIARQIDELREKVSSSDYLQVTATPYSLYLQPGEDDADLPARSRRPAFTELLPIHKRYVGGDFYFEEGLKPDSPARFVYQPVPETERDALKKEDQRRLKLDEILTAKNIAVLRHALMSFAVGTCVRRMQQSKAGGLPEKYSFIVHTEHSRASHNWQEQVVTALSAAFTETATTDPQALSPLIEASYLDLERSSAISDTEMPKYEEVLECVIHALRNGHLMVTKVNSENQVEQLLDDEGQLRLRTPLNVFIGGQILDRGVTIRNLIGFYYGRNPARPQQDTVLQHCRMYGARPPGDLAVTRFYTIPRIYEIMRKIHEFDSALRSAFERGATGDEVVFLRKDEGSLLPCAPNKILLSTTTTVGPYKRLLPVGFQTKAKTVVARDMAILDEKIGALLLEVGANERDGAIEITLELAQEILDLIRKTLVFSEESEPSFVAAKDALSYLSRACPSAARRNKVWCIVRKDRKNRRIRDDGRFTNSPDTPHEEGQIAKDAARDIPALLLYRQNGDEALGWKGTPFWWPLVVAPASTKTVVFANDMVDSE